MSDPEPLVTHATLPEATCPWCDHRLDAATRLGGTAKRGPKSGDVTLCASCTQPLFLTDSLALRRPEPGELEAFCRARPGLEEQLRNARRVLQSIDRRRL